MARYADRLLADGERVILRTRQHWLATIIEGRSPWAILVASLLLIWLSLSMAPGTLRTVVGYICLGLFLLALVWLAIVYWQWYVQDYMVTNRRVLKVDGILRKRSADSSLEKINDAILEQSVLGRMFNYGDLEIMTAAETPVDHYDFLSAAPNFKRTMLDAKRALEQEVYDFPGPPLRAAPLAPTPTPAAATASAGGSAAAVPGSADSPASPSAPAPAGTPALTPDEITRALGNLADLRDRGAISPEDYEAKKQDLLGRL